MTVVGAVIGVLLGWVVGVWGYFLVLKLGDGAGPDGIHVGALLMGLAGSIGGALLGFRHGAGRGKGAK